jgi:uncharacterized membrane protein YeaQ/YmgE (transglycosylase-associated protein family)
MNFSIWLAIGGLIGWGASMFMNTGAPQGVFLNICVVSIVGAMLGGWLLVPISGTGTINSHDFSVAGLAVPLLGAVVLLAIVNIFYRSGRQLDPPECGRTL